MLSQINAARGDDAMHIDDAASEDSEEEVCCNSRRVVRHALIRKQGRRVLHPWLTGAAQGAERDSGVLASQVGFCTPIGEDRAAYYVSVPLLTSSGLKSASLSNAWIVKYPSEESLTYEKKHSRRSRCCASIRWPFGFVSDCAVYRHTAILARR